MKIGYLALAIPAILFSVASAQASTTIVVQTLDLTKTSFGSGLTGVQSAPAFSPPFSVTLGEGDTFDYTINFKTGQTLTLNNFSFIWAFSYATTSTQTAGTGLFSFLDASGMPIFTSELKTDTEGDAHFGQQFGPSDFVAVLPPSLTFSGVRYLGTVDDYLDPTITSRTYNDPALFFVAETFSLVAPGVPEPTTWAMMLLGLGVVGGAMRRRKLTMRVAYT